MGKSGFNRYLLSFLKGANVLPLNPQALIMCPAPTLQGRGSKRMRHCLPSNSAEHAASLCGKGCGFGFTSETPVFHLSKWRVHWKDGHLKVPKTLHKSLDDIKYITGYS